MKFLVRRTSQWDRDRQPCDGAVQETWVKQDTRPYADPTKVPCNPLHDPADTRWWYGHGTNHRVENGHIVRDVEESGWFIEVASLEELLTFSGKEGEIIVSSGTYLERDRPSIEIYDDYRE